MDGKKPGELCPFGLEPSVGKGSNRSLTSGRSFSERRPKSMPCLARAWGTRCWASLLYGARHSIRVSINPFGRQGSLMLSGVFLVLAARTDL